MVLFISLLNFLLLVLLVFLTVTKKEFEKVKRNIFFEKTQIVKKRPILINPISKRQDEVNKLIEENERIGKPTELKDML